MEQPDAVETDFLPFIQQEEPMSAVQAQRILSQLQRELSSVRDKIRQITKVQVIDDKILARLNGSHPQLLEQYLQAKRKVDDAAMQLSRLEKSAPPPVLRTKKPEMLTEDQRSVILTITQTE